MIKSTKLFNKPLYKESFLCMLFSFLILGIVSIIGLNLSFFTPFNNAFKDFSYLDLYYSERLELNSDQINQDIFLVNVGQRNRKEIAGLIEKLNLQKPKVIGVDVIFREEKDPIKDRALANSFMLSNLITTYAFSNSEIIKTTNSIAFSKQISGYGNFIFDPKTVVIRNFQGFKNVDGTLHTSFVTTVAKKYMNTNWKPELETYLLKERPINYKGNRDNFMIFEYDDIMRSDVIPLLKDKIVLLGYLGNAQNHQYDIEDKHFTPMNTKFVGKSAPDTFGLIIHANIINMIITDDFILVVPDWLLTLLTIVFTYIALTYFIWLAKRGLASYVLRLNLIRLVFIICFVWLSLLLFRNGILFKTAGIIAIAAFSVGLIGYYKKLAHLLYKKFKWNGYFFQD